MASRPRKKGLSPQEKAARDKRAQAWINQRAIEQVARGCGLATCCTYVK